MVCINDLGIYILTLEFGTFLVSQKKNLELLEVMNSFVWVSIGTVEKGSHKPLKERERANKKNEK